MMCKLHICVIASESSLAWPVDYYYFAAAGGAKLWVRSSSHWYHLVAHISTLAAVEEAPHDDADIPVHHRHLFVPFWV